MEKTKNNSKHYLIACKWTLRRKNNCPLQTYHIAWKSDQNALPTKHKIPNETRMREETYPVKEHQCRQLLQTRTRHSTFVLQESNPGHGSSAVSQKDISIHSFLQKVNRKATNSKSSKALIIKISSTKAKYKINLNDIFDSVSCSSACS